MTVETVFSTLALVAAVGWGMFYVGVPLSPQIKSTYLTSIEPGDKFRQFIMPAFKFHGEMTFQFIS